MICPLGVFVTAADQEFLLTPFRSFRNQRRKSQPFPSKTYSYTLLLLYVFFIYAGKLLETIKVTIRRQKASFWCTKSCILRRLAAKLIRTQQYRTISVRISAERLYNCRIESMGRLIGLCRWSVMVEKLLQKSSNFASFGSICNVYTNGLADLSPPYFKSTEACISKGEVTCIQYRRG
jgi:hypothetical protein